MIKYFMISLIGIIVFINGYCIKKLDNRNQEKIQKLYQ